MIKVCKARFFFSLVIVIITINLFGINNQAFGASSPINQSEITKADQVIEKYLNAKGGKDRLDKIKTVVLKGTSTETISGKTYYYESYNKAPNKRLVVNSIPGVYYNRSGFDGKKAWYADSFTGIGEWKGKLREEVKQFSIMRSTFKELYPDIRFTGIEEKGNNETFVLESNRAGKHVKWNFDVQTGLLLSESIVKNTKDGFDRRVYEYKDYRVVDGIQTAFISSALHSGTKVKTTNFINRLQVVKYNIPVNDAVFKKPLNKFIADLQFIWDSRGKVRWKTLTQDIGKIFVRLMNH